ncbi:MAG TPA: ATP-binding protein [Bacteroidales bacterium]|nr:ATP-binding protein [Bacteroidales bacterium]
MVSERLLSSRTRIIFLILASVSFIAAGIFFQLDKIPALIVMLILGITFFIIINSIFNSTGDAVSFLFESLRNDDTTVRFSENIKNRRLSKVYASINRINEHFQEIKLRNEYSESYYRTIIQHASAGLLVLGPGNSIELINKTACIYAGISAESTNPDLLKIKHPAFYDAVCKLRPGETLTYKNLVDGNLHMLFFRTTMIRRKDEELKLVAIQDIRNELESREIESYRKLLSVLTHEIMNHLSPLTSVSRELFSIFSGSERSKEKIQVDKEEMRTAISGLKLINEQSDGLVRFMENYRKISKIPKPEFTSFSVDEWTEQLRIAFMTRMKGNGIEFSVNSDRSLKEIIGDRKLLNQVMVNLVNNAFDAVCSISEGDKKISINMMRNSQGRVLIRVSNNGPVIPAELVEKIFVPFFTTKPNGSGVGLSVCQEIIKMHNGSIVAISNVEGNTSFIAEF